MTSALSMRALAGALLLLAAMSASSLANAQTGILMTVQSASGGGQWPGETTRGGSANSIPLKAWSYSVKFPVDERSGTPAGQRRYAPVSFDKLIGAASPNILRAMLTNEPLNITVDVVGVGPSGTPVLLHRVTFSQARIISVARNAASAVDSSGRISSAPEMTETITFGFRQVEFDPGRGSATVMDELMTEG